MKNTRFLLPIIAIGLLVAAVVTTGFFLTQDTEPSVDDNLTQADGLF
jgi:hypothetical protein